MPENERCSFGGNATISETDTSRTSTTSTTRSAIRRRKKTSITLSIGKLDGGTTENHGKTRRQRLHLQLRNGKLLNGKRVGAHGIPHHLVISVFWMEFQKSDGREWTGPTHNTHLCSTVGSQARNAHTTRLAQELHCAQASKKEQSCVTKLALCGSPEVCKVVGVPERAGSITPIGAAGAIFLSFHGHQRCSPHFHSL